jgi:outer membrane protein
MIQSIYKALILLLVFPAFYVFSEQGTVVSVERKKTEGFLYGLGLSVNKEIYKGYNTRIMPLPLLGYQGENLSVFGPFINYKLINANRLTLSAKLSPRFQGFDESDSAIFKGMRKRKSSFDIGFGLDYQQNDWKIGLSSMFDALNRSNGFEIKSTIGHVFRYGPIFFEPSFSLSFLDKHHVDYYYGVSKDEVNQNRSAYLGHSGVNKNIGFSMATPIFFGGYTRLNLEYTWFDKSITDSPLVEDNSSLQLLLVFTKNF